MLKLTNRTTNTNDTATLSDGIVMNAATSITVAAANSNRIYIGIFNDGLTSIWLKLQAAGVDNDKKGILLAKGSFYEMISDNVYTGELCGIAVTGTPSVFVTEY